MAVVGCIHSFDRQERSQGEKNGGQRESHFEERVSGGLDGRGHGGRARSRPRLGRPGRGRRPDAGPSQAGGQDQGLPEARPDGLQRLRHQPRRRAPEQRQRPPGGPRRRRSITSTRPSTTSAAARSGRSARSSRRTPASPSSSRPSSTSPSTSRITKAELRDRFMKCLERMGTDHADCLMIHMCTLAQVKYEPYHELIGELKAEGKVRFSGLSNHGADLSLFGPPRRPHGPGRAWPRPRTGASTSCSSCTISSSGRRARGSSRPARPRTWASP